MDEEGVIPMTEIAGLDVSNIGDVEAMLALLREARKNLVEADRERLGAMLTEFVTTVVTETPELESSEKSGWHGIKKFGIPAEVDGRKFSVSVTLTDVSATDAAKAALKAATGEEPAEEPAEPETVNA